MVCAHLATTSGLSVALFTGPYGEDGMPNLSVPTGRVEIQHQVLIKSDAGRVIETPIYIYDLGLPDKKELELHLSGDDASSLRWRISRKPDPLTLEWYAVDGQPAYETGDLIGDPSTAAKVLEFRGGAVGETPSSWSWSSAIRHGAQKPRTSDSSSASASPIPFPTAHGTGSIERGRLYRSRPPSGQDVSLASRSRSKPTCRVEPLASSLSGIRT